MQETRTSGHSTIRDRLREYIVENFLFGSTDERFTDEASFLETGIIDSTGILELISFVETEYGISIQDHEIVPKNLDSLENIARFVARKRPGE